MNKALTFKKKDLCLDCKDYRGIKVISSYQYIPEIHWGIVTEIDYDEIFSQVRKLFRLFTILALVGMLLLGVAAFFLGSFFSKPLEKLIVSINKFKYGSLSERADVKMNNEIGVLTNSFNGMASTIENNISRLNQSNESLNKFGYIISHDLKGPVQTIYSLTEMIKEEYANKPLDKEGLKMLDMLNSKSRQMEEMINDVLKAAKSGGHSQDKQELNSKEIVQQAVDNLKTHSHIEIIISEELPIVNYNKTALFQIFINYF